jgi:C_GCAxxG_C_C family probable redox protein
MGRTERAVNCFQKGFNCAQAVFSAYGPELGLDRKAAYRIAQAFGGGIARRGEICGAVTGAFLVLGLKYGRTRAKDEEAKERTYALVLDFIRKFEQAYGSLQCRELLGVDLSTPQGRKEAEKKKLHDTLCTKFIASAIEILEGLL